MYNDRLNKVQFSINKRPKLNCQSVWKMWAVKKLF